MAEDKFSSKMGAIAAAAGSAVGLGNIWRFPYIVGENGGAAFLLLYVFFTIAFAIPVLMTEMSIGRMSGKPVTSAFITLCPDAPAWQIIGFGGMLTAFLIVSYYNIVSGWTLYYAVTSVTGSLDGLSEAEVAQVFTSLQSDPVRCIIWMSLMLFFTAAIVSQGVAGGIEKYSKILMPILLILIVVMLIRAITLEGGTPGLNFYLKPDFSKLTSKSVFDAMGQSFFSLSVGMGTMTTYGSYVQKRDSLSNLATRVAMVDFLVAFLAGAVIFPCVFAFGINPGEGPGLVFVTLPNIFNQMPMGIIFESLFFILLVVAALTSSLSLLEVVVAYFINSFGMSRRKATAAATALALVFGIACSVSSTIFNIFDKFTANLLMPLGALFIVLFAVHKLPREQFKAELEAHGAPYKLFPLFYAQLKFVIPIVIILIFINSMMAWLGVSL